MRDQEKVKAARRRHYYKNKEAYKKRAVARRELLYQIAVAFKDKPCADCGVWYPPCVMDFDHLEDKKGNITFFYGQGSIDKMVNEILKCEVVCSNCHRIRTHKRLRGLDVTAA